MAFRLIQGAPQSLPRHGSGSALVHGCLVDPAAAVIKHVDLAGTPNPHGAPVPPWMRAQAAYTGTQQQLHFASASREPLHPSMVSIVVLVGSCTAHGAEPHRTVQVPHPAVRLGPSRRPIAASRSGPGRLLSPTCNTGSLRHHPFRNPNLALSSLPGPGMRCPLAHTLQARQHTNTAHAAHDMASLQHALATFVKELPPDLEMCRYSMAPRRATDLTWMPYSCGQQAHVGA